MRIRIPERGELVVRTQVSTVDKYLMLDDRVLVAQCDVDHYRARGPGGQKRNKTSSAVRLRHRPTGLAAIATEDRSQHVNKKRAIRRLRETIAHHSRSNLAPDNYERSELLSSCVTADRRLRVGRRDDRYYLVVCELLDILAACGTGVRDAAKCLGVSTAGLVEFIRRDRKLWERVNQMRGEAGISLLR